MAISRKLWNDMVDDLSDIKSDVSDAMSRRAADGDPTSREFVNILESVYSLLDDLEGVLYRVEVER